MTSDHVFIFFINLFSDMLCTKMPNIVPEIERFVRDFSQYDSIPSAHVEYLERLQRSPKIGL